MHGSSKNALCWSPIRSKHEGHTLTHGCGKELCLAGITRCKMSTMDTTDDEGLSTLPTIHCIGRLCGTINSHMVNWLEQEHATGNKGLGQPYDCKSHHTTAPAAGCRCASTQRDARRPLMHFPAALGRGLPAGCQHLAAAERNPSWHAHSTRPSPHAHSLGCAAARSRRRNRGQVAPWPATRLCR